VDEKHVEHVCEPSLLYCEFEFREERERERERERETEREGEGDFGRRRKCCTLA